VKRLAVILALAGCASATGTISRETNDVRSAAIRARDHLVQAQRELDEIDSSAAQVHQQVAYVDDRESPVWATMKFVSVAVGLAAAAAIVYRIKK
jgi:hypothetical protein